MAKKKNQKKKKNSNVNKKKNSVVQKKKVATKRKSQNVKRKKSSSPARKKVTKKKKTNKHKNKKYLQFVLVFILGIILIGGIQSYINSGKTFDIPLLDNKNEEEEKLKRQQQENDYNNCLKRKYDERDYTVDMLNMKQEISNYIVNNKYKVSVNYEDIVTGFNYTYNPNTVYYGCSLIKLVDALYLINKAINGEIDLDKETITYAASYRASDSKGMQTRKIGEKVTLRDLITYAISVSDNTAHFMLIDYIGFNNLQAYGRSLGAKVILTGGDKFGNQTVEDTNIYLKEVYQIINENEEYGPFLKSIMGNDVRNAFNTDDIKIYHKYGSYGVNYHDIGLSLEEHPYAISIFTLHEDKNYIEVVQGIHSKIRELHDAFYENREKICKREVYGS